MTQHPGLSRVGSAALRLLPLLCGLFPLHGAQAAWAPKAPPLATQWTAQVSPTNALPSTREFADLLARKGIPHELDVWGHDTPHDWPSWQAQLRHHLPRFC